MTAESDTPANAGTATETAAPKTAAELFAMEEAPDQGQADATRDDDDTAGEASDDSGPEDEADGDDPEAETDGEPDDEGQTDEEGSKEPVTVEIDGKPVNLEELKSGYLRQQDYTRKTQALASERNELGAATERVTQIDREARQALELAATVLRSIVPPEPDLSLIDASPAEYLKAKEAREQTIAALQRLEAERGQSEARQTQAQRDAEARAIQQELARAAEAIPELSTAEGRAKFRAEAIEIGAKVYGLTADEIDSIKSAKEMKVLRDALAWRKLQSQKMANVAKAKSAPKMVAKPGTRETKPANRLDQLRSLGKPVLARDIFASMEK